MSRSKKRTSIPTYPERRMKNWKRDVNKRLRSINKHELRTSDNFDELVFTIPDEISNLYHESPKDTCHPQYNPPHENSSNARFWAKRYKQGLRK